MDESQKKMIAAYAGFEKELADLRKRQLKAIEDFAGRATKARVKEIRDKVFGYGDRTTGEDPSGN